MKEVYTKDMSLIERPKWMADINQTSIYYQMLCAIDESDHALHPKIKCGHAQE